MADASKYSDFNYWWLIVFEWSHKTQTPFSIHVLNPTFNDIVPEDWILGKLLEEHRLKKLRINTLDSSIPYSIFTKVEKGILIIFNIFFIIYIIY